MSETTKTNRKQLLEHRQHVNRGIIDHNNKRAYEEIVKSCIATGRSRLGVAEWENEPRVKRCLNFYLREFAVMFRASSGCERRHRWNQNKQHSVCWRKDDALRIESEIEISTGLTFEDTQLDVEGD